MNCNENKTNKANIHTILLDMDGVVIDDIECLAPSSGLSSRKFKEKLQYLSIVGGKNEYLFPIIIKAIEDKAFETAPTTMFSYALQKCYLNHWKDLDIKVEFLSSTMSINPCRESLAKQKQISIETHFKGMKLNLVEGSALKQTYAKPGVLLIDDYQRTVSQFIQAGGYAICHKETNSTIEQLGILGLLY